QGLLLIVHHHAGQVDSHVDPSGRLSHRSTIDSSGVGLMEWNLYRPSRLVSTRPAASRTSRCCEMACRDEPSPCLEAKRAQISKSVCPFLSVSSSRIARRVGSAKALKTSPTPQHVRQVSTCLSRSHR